MPQRAGSSASVRWAFCLRLMMIIEMDQSFDLPQFETHKRSQTYNLPIMDIKNINLEAHSPRKLLRRNSNVAPKPPKNYLKNLLQLVMPPFLLTALVFVFRLVSRVFRFLFSFFESVDNPGETSLEFNKRKYETDIEQLQLQQQDLGFSNQVLVQETKKTVNLYVPVYVACKIKSIQDVSVQSLTGNISCALLINIKYSELPEEIVKKLEDSVLLQLNRSEAMILAHDGLGITLKKNEKAELLTFTLRKVFLAFMIEDTLWSPFEVLDLIISLTLNTVTIPPHGLTPLKQFTGYNPQKEYKISFNCMRNSDLIPMSFDLDCVYGVYDLAERRLESYHTNISSFKQVQKNHEEFLKAKAKGKEEMKKERERLKLQKKEKEKKKEDEKIQRKRKLSEAQIRVISPKNISEATKDLVRGAAEMGRGLSTMRLGPGALKGGAKKVKYFQYTHLVISLYKYPGNVLITIFLPVMLLAMLSLAIFFQEPELSGRIGSIATMFLGYIALIPSIKEQLPPSAKLTVIEGLVYIEALSCMLCLYESFIIKDIVDYVFEWQQNPIFLLCLMIHSGVFLFVLGLYVVHKIRWEPNYNCDEEIAEVRPADNSVSWDNPYCDAAFLKYNRELQEENCKQDKLIRPYQNPAKDNSVSIGDCNRSRDQKKSRTSKKEGEEQISLSHFGSGLKLSEIKEQNMEQSWLKVPTSPRSMSEFVVPDPELYHKGI